MASRMFGEISMDCRVATRGEVRARSSSSESSRRVKAIGSPALETCRNPGSMHRSSTRWTLGMGMGKHGGRRRGRGPETHPVRRAWSDRLCSKIQGSRDVFGDVTSSEDQDGSAILKPSRLGRMKMGGPVPCRGHASVSFGCDMVALLLKPALEQVSDLKVLFGDQHAHRFSFSTSSLQCLVCVSYS